MFNKFNFSGELMYGDSKLFIYINKKNVIKTKLTQITHFWSEILTL